MRVTRRNLQGRVSLLFAVLGIMSCADPTTATRAALAPGSARAFVSSVDGSTISISDVDGTAYVFDGAAKELRVSDGTVIEIPDELVATYANGFMDIVISDSYANQLTTNPPPEGEGHGGPCGALPCESAIGPNVVVDTLSKSHSGMGKPVYGTQVIWPKVNPKSQSEKKNGGVTTATYSCSDLADNINGAAYFYRQSRPSLFGAIKSAISSSGVTGAAALISKSTWLAVSASVGSYFINHSVDRLNLQISVVLYNSQGCTEYYSHQVSSMVLGGGLYLSCTSEYVTLQLAHGSWSGWVSTCIYLMQ